MTNRTGLVAVITGASRGLGAGMAQTFAGHGIRLGLCARNRPEPPAGSEAWTSSVDVTDAKAVESFARSTVEQFGSIDLWVNNAGVLAPIGLLADADPDAVHRHIDINVLGVIHGSASFARHVRSRPGAGVLVNISSGAATTPYEGWGPYCGSKAAVEMITEVLSREESDQGLRAYAVAPGVVDTDMQALIRSTPAALFPMKGRFQQKYEEGALNSADWVARFILERLVDGDPQAGRGSAVASDTVRLRVPDQKGRG
jgi:NAD(P)-dependent dehydrogenase (short-subunit alcohol dehydrogenase family)